jgi:hypothetical protein
MLAPTSRRTSTPLAGRFLPGVGSIRRSPEQGDPSHRSPERLVNQAVPVLNSSRRDDAVLRAIFEMNENFNSLNRKVDQISGRIDTHRPREEYDPMNELPVKTLEEFVSLENLLSVDKKKREALVSWQILCRHLFLDFFDLM